MGGRSCNPHGHQRETSFSLTSSSKGRGNEALVPSTNADELSEYGLYAGDASLLVEAIQDGFVRFGGIAARVMLPDFVARKAMNMSRL
jgi:hypothetical protein